MARSPDVHPLRDLSDELVVNDAEHDLRTAEEDGSDAALASWARKWAEPALALCGARAS